METIDGHSTRTWVALWVAEHGHVHRGILSAVRDGTRKSLAIMDANPGRYPEHAREDMREALDVLMTEVDDNGFPQYATQP